MSIAAVAGVIGAVAGGLAIGTTVNSIVNGGGGGNINLNLGAGGGAGGGQVTPLLSAIASGQQQQVAAENQTNDNLATLNQNIITQTQAQATESQQSVQSSDDQEYITIGLAVVSLACFLFLHKKKGAK